MQKTRRQKIVRPKKPPSTSVGFSKLTLHRLDWLEWFTIIVAVWFFVMPEPYEVLLGILLSLPILGILLNGWQRPSLASLVEISKDKDGEDKYDVADFIDIAAWVILVRVLLDFEFDSLSSMIIPGTIACVLILAILFLTHRLIGETTKSKWWIYTSLIFNVCLYSYAGTYAANCVYDSSRPRVYPTQVLDKRISKSRRSTTYYVEVAPWGHHRDKEEIRVSSREYDQIGIGDSIAINLKEGLFGIPWYYVQRTAFSRPPPSAPFQQYEIQ